MIVQLVLQGRYSANGELFANGNSRRIVPVDLDIKEEREDIKKFFCKDENREVWGLADGDMWWYIVAAFEVIEPTLELHANKYPVSYAVLEGEFDEIMKEATNGI